MANFALLDDQNIVTNIVVVDDTEIANDMDLAGEEFCKNLFKVSNCKQYSEEGSFRKRPANIGGTYDPIKDIFIRVKPYPSWILSSDDEWEAPITHPSIETYGDPATSYRIKWNETDQRWEAADRSDPIKNFIWDTVSLTWSEV
tara:strand:- start:36 stop:467 length:432 start_codon:yes stop_codon:yes gene_type:complete